MKFLTILLLTLSAFCGFDRLSASPASDLEQYLTSVWTSNQGYLFFNINLANELKFDDAYSTFEMIQGQGCEIVCRPIQNGTVFSDEGYELKEINLTVALENWNDPTKVDFTTTVKTLYKKYNERGLVEDYTYSTETTGVLTTPTIALTHDPEFFTLEDEHHGIIAFRDAH